MSKLTFEELKEWGKGREFSSKPLELSTGGKVTDRKKLFNSHVATLESKKTRAEKLRFVVYWDRLVELYNSENEEKTRP